MDPSEEPRYFDPDAPKLVRVGTFDRKLKHKSKCLFFDPSNIVCH